MAAHFTYSFNLLLILKSGRVSWIETLFDFALPSPVYTIPFSIGQRNIDKQL